MLRGGTGGEAAGSGIGGALDPAGATGGMLTGGIGGEGAPCLYDGVIYDDGNQFTAIDGCNDCGCSNGNTMCTALWCSFSCNQQWGAGRTFYESEGCERCTCQTSGESTCVAITPCIVCEDEGTTHYPGDSWTRACGAQCNCTTIESDGVTVGEVVCVPCE